MTVTDSLFPETRFQRASGEPGLSTLGALPYIDDLFNANCR
ncbi:MAG: hypothetical protein ABR888_00030 [Thermoplasmata archaeon]